MENMQTPFWTGNEADLTSDLATRRSGPIFHEFLKNWEDTLKNSHEVIFEQNIGTISYYFLERLKTKQKIKKTSQIDDKSQLKLLKILQNIINRNGTETKILRRLSLTAIHELGKKPNQPSTRLHIRYFKEIDDAYNDPKFVKSVETQLLESLDSSESTNECVKYLIRSLLRRYSIKYLEKEVPKIFARSFFELHNCAIRDKVTSSNKLQPEQLTLLNCLYKKTIKKLYIYSSSQKRKEYLRHLHLNSIEWNDRDLFLIISNAKRTMRNENLTDKIERLGDSPSESDIYTVLNQQPLHNIFYTIITETCFRFIFNIVSEPHDRQHYDFIHDISELEFCHEFSRLIKSVIYQNNNPPSLENFNHNISSSSYQIFLEAYSRIMQTKVSETKLKTLTDNLIRQVSIFFAAELKNNDVDVLNKFKLNRIITEHARNTCYDIFEVMLAEMQNTPQEYVILQIKQSFINDLLDHFFNKVNRLPFTCDLTKSQMCRFITTVCQKFQKPSEKIRVCCLLGGLDCDQKCFQIGNVTFYDARIWDFGEDTVFDQTMGASMSIAENLRTKYGDPYDTVAANSAKRNSARAMVDVVAYDYESAINQAEIAVQNAANSLVYASTAFVARGFKPQIPADYVLIFNDGESAKKIMGPRTQDHDFLIMNDKYLEISNFYNDLVLEPPTKLNNSLIRALEWYNRGHWSEIAHQKFVLLWIALEQLIGGSLHVRKVSTNNLLKSIARLIVTWRDKNYNLYLLQLLDAMMNSIHDDPKSQALLDTNPKLKGWRQNYGIVLENLDDVALLENSDVSNYARSISKHLTPEYFKHIEYMIKTIRKKTLFKIALLNSKRNSLFHKGIFYSGELTVMSSELEKILVDAIELLIQFRDKRELSKIIDENNRPFYVRDRLVF